jgi:hypothetical protein
MEKQMDEQQRKGEAAAAKRIADEAAKSLLKREAELQADDGRPKPAAFHSSKKA